MSRETQPTPLGAEALLKVGTVKWNGVEHEQVWINGVPVLGDEDWYDNPRVNHARMMEGFRKLAAFIERTAATEPQVTEVRRVVQLAKDFDSDIRKCPMSHLTFADVFNHYIGDDGTLSLALAALTPSSPKEAQ